MVQYPLTLKRRHKLFTTAWVGTPATAGELVFFGTDESLFRAGRFHRQAAVVVLHGPRVALKSGDIRAEWKTVRFRRRGQGPRGLYAALT